MNRSTCPFCEPDAELVFFQDELVVALWDRYPSSPGHALLIPRRHVADWFDATSEEQGRLMATTRIAKQFIESEHGPDGFNLGINVGPAAGQTVGHLHLHVIPRYKGDVTDPRGGIRWVLPETAPYWALE